MKNKEIEKILNYMKQYIENKYEHDSEPMLNYKDLQIVLSYIEQLENNRDKAIEYIENHSRFEPPYYEMREFNNKANLSELYNILKGDSE